MAAPVRSLRHCLAATTLLLLGCAPSGSAAPSAIVTATPGRTVATPAAAVPTATPAAEFPSQILDLSRWKLQLPVNADAQFTGRYVEIQQPQLARYLIAPYFVVRGDAIQFRAPVNGLTTSGSMYPRSELREMTGDGRAQAAWSTTEGTHTMTVEQAITAAPAVKRHVVAGQIHDGTDDVITIRLENSKLFVDHSGVDGPTLTSSYVLGTRFTVTVEASGGQIRVYYNNSPTPADTYAKPGDSMYFKAGAYVQSNCQREAVCAPTNYGEVLIHRLSVAHR